MLPAHVTVTCTLQLLLFFLKASAPEVMRLTSNLSFHYEKCEQLDFIVVEEKPENEKPKAYKPFSLTKKTPKIY